MEWRYYIFTGLQPFYTWGDVELLLQAFAKGQEPRPELSAVRGSAESQNEGDGGVGWEFGGGVWFAGLGFVCGLWFCGFVVLWVVCFFLLGVWRVLLGFLLVS